MSAIVSKKRVFRYRARVFIIFLAAVHSGFIAAMSRQASQGTRVLYQQALRKSLNVAPARSLAIAQNRSTDGNKEKIESSQEQQKDSGAEQNQQSSGNWNRWKLPAAGLFTAGAVAGIAYNKIFLERNRQMQRELEESLKDTLSGIHFKNAPDSLVAIVRGMPLAAKDQFIRALKKEEELLKQGYICFYHAQHSAYGGINDVLNTVFFQLAGIVQPDDFRFIQIRSHDMQKRSVAAKNNEHEKLMRADSDKNPHPLSVNLFAFGNTGPSSDEGSSTLRYLINNHSVVKCDISQLNDALHAMGMPVHSIKELEPLAKRVEKLSADAYSTGRLLLIAVPHQKIDRYVFPAQYKMFGKSDQRKPVVMYGKVMHTMSDVIQTIQKESARSGRFPVAYRFEAAIPIHSVGLLNPYSGIKVFAIDGFPRSRTLQSELKQAQSELVNAIMAEFKKSGTLKKAEKLVRDYMDELPLLVENKPWLSHLMRW